MKVKYAVGSVAQRAVEGSDSLLEAAKADVNEINRGPAEETLLSTPDRGAPQIRPEASPEESKDVEEELSIPVPVLASIWFSENTEPPVEEEVDAFEDAVTDAVTENEPVFKFKDKIYSIDKASLMEVTEELDQERKGFFFGSLAKRVKKLSKGRKSKKGGRGLGGAISRSIERLRGRQQKASPAPTKVINMGNVVATKFPRFSSKEVKKPMGGFFSAIGKMVNKQAGSGVKKQVKKGAPSKRNKPFKNSRGSKFYRGFKGRFGFEEGGMPVDTYPNIAPEDMAEVKASQLPDSEMEAKYEEFILGEALSPIDQDYLMDSLGEDAKLSTIFDRVMDVATEFSGAGAVEGIGTGVSDSIPARLSDGEFVFTAKAVEAIGVENLQRMMDDAERSFDERDGKAYGGAMSSSAEDDESIDYNSRGDNISTQLNAILLEANPMSHR
jgi:hypothetical protein